MTFSKESVKRALLSFGLEIRRVDQKPEPPAVYEDMLEAFTQMNSGERASYLCPVSKCVILNGFSFARDSWHPLVEATKQYIESDYSRAYAGSLLELYYTTWRPKNALQALIGARNGPANLAQYPAYAMHSPWSDISPMERQALMSNIIRDENRWSGNDELDVSHGYGLHGPVSEKKGLIEYGRLTRIANSLRSRGYDRSLPDGDVTVVAIECGGDYRFCISHGQHRVAALAALGYDHLPVSMNKIVTAAELDHWPQVYRGVWSKGEAMEYIRHLFEFDAMAWARNRGLA